MRLAFMGTPQFAVPSLSELIANGHDVAAVYTQPPRRAGRGQKLQPSPVQLLAEVHGLEIRTPSSFRGEDVQSAFADLSLDVAIVVAYGLILPAAILKAPQHGCVNLHGSLLPRWRGAAPVQRAIMAGDRETGVQLMQMEKGLDTGAILLSETVPITSTDTSGTLQETLSHIGASLLPRALAALSRGKLEAVPQQEHGVLYADKIVPAEARIDWARPVREVDWHIRGLSPIPGAWFEIRAADGERVRCKVLMSSVSKSAFNGPPGTLVRSDDRLLVTCADAALSLERIQRSGKSIQSIEEFLRGFPVAAGQVLA